MPYPPEHKARTRRRILRSAAGLFAAQGFEKTSIEEVMAAAGLTRGGFYAHFESKAALHAEAMRMAGEGASLPADPRLAVGWLEDVLDVMDRRATRREAPTGEWRFLVTDAAHADPNVRSSYEVALRRLVASLTPLRHGTALPDEAALQAVALVVGWLVIDGTVDDDAVRGAFLQACRRFLENRANRSMEAEHQEVLWDVSVLAA